MRIGSSAATLPAYSTTSEVTPGGEGAFLAAFTAASRQIASQTAITPPTTSSIDFHSATRQELFDWMNSQLRSGQMTFEESAPFLGMTFKFDPVAGRLVDMATDTSRVDFMQRARDGIEGALWRFDEEGAERLRAALATMKKFDV